jgi:hypothetical protein
MSGLDSANGGGRGSKTTLNRFGVRTENAGKIRFRCQVSVTDPRLEIPVDSRSKEVEDSNVTAVRRTVDDILKEFRAGASVAKSIEAASRRGTALSSSGVLGLSSSSADLGGSLRSSTSTGTLLAKRAEALIAQAKMRISTNGSTVGSSTSSSAIREAVQGALSSSGSAGYDSKQDDDSAPLLGTMNMTGSRDRGADLSSTLGSTLDSRFGGTGNLAPLREEGKSSESASSIRSPISRRYAGGGDDEDDGNASDRSTDGFLTRTDGDDSEKN